MLPISDNATTDSLAFLQQASETEFAAWVADPDRPPFDEDVVADAKAMAQDLDSLDDSLRVLNRLECLPEVDSAPLKTALVLRGRANVYQAHERFEESLAAAQEAVEIYRKHGTRFDQAVASVIQVVVLGSMGNRYDEAISLARRIRPFIGRGQNAKPVLAHLALARAVAHTVALRLKAALADYRRALHHFAQIANSDAEIALTLLNMGVLANQMDLLDAARSWLLTAFATFEEEQSTINLVKACFALANNSTRRGEYQEALEHLTRARSGLETHPDSPDNGFVDLETAAIRVRLNQMEQAEDLARQALARFEDLGRSLDTAEALLFLARILAHANSADTVEEASSLLQRAEQILQKHEMPVFVALVQLEQSELLLRRGLPNEARIKAEIARPVFIREKLVLLHAQAQLVLGDSCWRWEPVEAKRHYRMALTFNHDLDAQLTARAYRGLARLDGVAGRWEKAETNYVCALEALDRLRRQLRSHLHQAGFLEDKRPLALELFAAINAVVLSGKSQPTHLFDWLERWKAVALADLLTGQPPDLDLDSATQALLREREQLVSRFDELQRTGQLSDFGSLSSPQRAHAVSAENTAHRHELVRLRVQLQSVDEQLAPRSTPSIAWRQGATIDLATIHELVDADTLLVSYYSAAGPTAFQNQGIDRLYAISATNRPGDLAIHDLQVTFAEVWAEWERIYPLVTELTWPDTAADREKTRLMKRLARLYNMLIRPFAARLKDKNRLIVLPERDLAHIPFAALYDSETGKHLLETMMIQTAPSATVLAGCRRRPFVESEAVLFGYPGDPKSPDYLPQVRPEIVHIAEILGSPTVRLDDETTVENFWQLVRNCPLFHFAGHARFDARYPLESGLELAAARYLRASDLYLHYGQLPGTVVVLSACSTGKGKSWGGDTLGLISAFLYAGASSVIAGLWPADDSATAILMRHFYENLTNQHDAACALRLAQLELISRDQFSSPYYWATFSLCGDSRVI